MPVTDQNEPPVGDAQPYVGATDLWPLLVSASLMATVAVQGWLGA